MLGTVILYNSLPKNVNVKCFHEIKDWVST